MNEFTFEEIESYLCNTDMPTVIVEGVSDAKIYRWIEEYLQLNGHPDVSVISVGGRVAVQSLYKNRGTLASVPIVFTADLDAYLFLGVPSVYKNIVFTSGYSIENDIMDENVLLKLMDTKEKGIYQRIKEIVSEWYAGQVGDLQSSGVWLVANNLHAVLDIKTLRLKEVPVFDPILYQFIYDNYYYLVRGKHIIDVFSSIFNSSTRGKNKFSKENIISMCLSLGTENSLLDLATRVKKKLDIESITYPIAR